MLCLSIHCVPCRIKEPCSQAMIARADKMTYMHGHLHCMHLNLCIDKLTPYTIVIMLHFHSREGSWQLLLLSFF